MFVTVIFNVEYMDITSRKMWYLKNLLHCKDNGWIMITHDYIRKHFEELQDSITDRFINQFEMRRFTLEEVKDVEQYFVSDEIFDGLEREKGSRTEMLFDLISHPNEKLDASLHDIFNQVQQRHPNEKIEGIFHCLEGYESLRKISEEIKCPLINYSFSAFRKVHGYRQTLYAANLYNHFWDDKECAARYDKFLQEDYSMLPVFTNQELIAMIGKQHTLPLIQLINSQPKYEMGICCECYALLPQVFKNKPYTDDDIFYECKRLFGSDKLKVRSHAAHLNDIQVDRSEVHNDPVSTMLSCKRLTAVQSQILLKVLLWKRTAVLNTPSLAFGFLCDRDYKSEKIADIVGLNYYILGFLIPSELMFSDEYWKWRLTNPSEVEIYQKHLNFLFNVLGLNKKKVLSLQGKERFKYLLEARGCDKQLIDNLLSDEIINNINWDVASSQFDVVTSDGSKTYWRIDTENEDGSLTSKLVVDVKDTTSVRFYPLYDVAGFAKLKNVKINGDEVALDSSMLNFQYMPKGKGCFILSIGATKGNQLDVECNWEYMKINDFLNSNIKL